MARALATSAAVIALGALCGVPRAIHAAEPAGLRFGRLTVGGEVAGALAPADTAFFDDTGYRSHPLRRFSLTLQASLDIAAPLALLAEGRSYNLDAPRLYALYLRYRPWSRRSLDVQAGLIPPVFGSFARRAYGSGNPLIGYPLAYQYLTIVRSDAAPASADDLLRSRGFGWLVRYPVGSPYGGAGLPMVDGQRWDAGVEVRVGREPLQIAAALTQGSLSYPRTRDDNDGKQVSTRVQAVPSQGLVLGASFARGEYADRTLRGALPSAEAARALRQTGMGLDFEYSRGHALVRAEAIFSAWDLPVIARPPVDGRISARSISLESVFRMAPGFDAAARFDRLGFDEIQGSTRKASWDAPVTRVEAGLTYALRRGLLLKGAYQHNWREAGPRGRRGFPAAQLLWRF